MSEQSTWKFSTWKVGNKVWLEATNLQLSYPSRKLAPKHYGPFEIAQVLSPLSYWLRLPPTWKIHNVFHTLLLSTHHQTEAHGPSFPRPPPDLIDNEEEYEVDHIVSHKESPGWWLHLTAWKGYSFAENTWESKSNLCHTPALPSAYKHSHHLVWSPFPPLSLFPRKQHLFMKSPPSECTFLISSFWTVNTVAQKSIPMFACFPLKLIFPNTP